MADLLGSSWKRSERNTSDKGMTDPTEAAWGSSGPLSRVDD